MVFESVFFSCANITLLIPGKADAVLNLPNLITTTW